MNRLIFLFGIILLITINNSCQKATDFASIYGVVSDSETKYPINGVTVVLMQSGEPKITKTDGKFEFKELDEGYYDITYSKEGYVTDRKNKIFAIKNKPIEASTQLKPIENP